MPITESLGRDSKNFFEMSTACYFFVLLLARGKFEKGNNKRAKKRRHSIQNKTFWEKENVSEKFSPNPVVKWPGSDLMTLTMYLCGMKRFEKMVKSRNPNGEAQNFNEAHLQFYSKTVPLTMYNVQCTMYNV